MRSRHLMLAAIMTLALAGCAKGAPFQALPALPQDKAVIYIYRPSVFGFAKDYDVRRGDAVIVTMKSHGYYPYVTDPGVVELSATTETTDSVTLDAKPGQAYYVKAGMTVGFWVDRPRLSVVSREEAEKGLAHCKLLAAGER
jgi:hypothetical protein